LDFFTGRLPCLTPSQLCWSTDWQTLVYLSPF